MDRENCSTELEFAHIQRREGHWAIVDLVGKGRHIRTVPVPEWVKTAIDSWCEAAGVSGGRVFRCFGRAGKTWETGVTERVVWHVVKNCAKRAGMDKLAPHDLRRYAHGCVVKLAASWIKFSSFLATSQSRQPRNILAANNAFKTRSTTGSASNPTIKESEVSGDRIGSSF
jgi:integrase